MLFATSHKGLVETLYARKGFGGNNLGRFNEFIYCRLLVSIPSVLLLSLIAKCKMQNAKESVQSNQISFNHVRLKTFTSKKIVIFWNVLVELKVEAHLTAS